MNDSLRAESVASPTEAGMYGGDALRLGRVTDGRTGGRTDRQSTDLLYLLRFPQLHGEGTQ